MSSASEILDTLNDTYGHIEGEEIIEELNNIRGPDYTSVAQYTAGVRRFYDGLEATNFTVTDTYKAQQFLAGLKLGRGPPDLAMFYTNIQALDETYEVYAHKLRQYCKRTNVSWESTETGAAFTVTPNASPRTSPSTSTTSTTTPGSGWASNRAKCLWCGRGQDDECYLGKQAPPEY